MPMTRRQWQDSLRQPALCELLPVRDYLDGCIVRTNGSFVAGYEATGLNTFFHADETRNRTKEVLEALVRSLPERSMRMQIRYEVTDGHGDLTERYVKEQRIENAVLQALDRERIRLWNTRQQEGHYLRRRLHVYFIWNPDDPPREPGFRMAEDPRESERVEFVSEQVHPANFPRTRGFPFGIREPDGGSTGHTRSHGNATAAHDRSGDVPRSQAGAEPDRKRCTPL